MRNVTPILYSLLLVGLLLFTPAMRAFDAMMGMKKIEVAAIKAARRG
jgi:hypothetical protein